MPVRSSARAPKPPTLRAVLRGFGATLKEDEHRSRSSQILARAVVMSMAAALGDVEYRKEIGMALTHQRLLYNISKNLWATARRDYGALSGEIRKLMTDGPTKYYQRALKELGSFAPHGS